MKATGEVMAIGRTYEESLLKAIRSLIHEWIEDRHVLPEEVRAHHRNRT